MGVGVEFERGDDGEYVMCFSSAIVAVKILAPLARGCENVIVRLRAYRLALETGARSRVKPLKTHRSD